MLLRPSLLCTLALPALSFALPQFAPPGGAGAAQQQQVIIPRPAFLDSSSTSSLIPSSSDLSSLISDLQSSFYRDSVPGEGGSDDNEGGGGDGGDGDDDGEEEPVGHFTLWCRETKADFLHALKSDNAKDWVVVMGNDAGDLDSMVSALATAYTLTHQPKPVKAVALLQTEQDALYLRPENTLALKSASTHHSDLLTIDELPIKPVDLWHRIDSIFLVDHNVPLSVWWRAKISGIFDHHEDSNKTLKASPRIIAPSASCSSHVARWLLDTLNYKKKGHVTTQHNKIPRELAGLLLSAIAIDSSGLKKAQSEDVDRESAERLLAVSEWRKDDLKERMNALDDELSTSKKNLTELDVRALLRRDWKGDSVTTNSTKYPYVHLGFASAPVSIAEQILRTPEGTTPEWFAIERAWTSEIGADISVCLTNYRDSDDRKTHEIVLVVAHGLGKRLHEKEADSLFHTLDHAIQNSGFADLQVWNRPDGKPLLPRRAAYRHYDDASRKMWRPIIEAAARAWRG